MSYLKKLERFIDKNRQRAEEPNHIPTLEQILRMGLSELTSHDIGIRVFSEVLGCEVWLCSNEEMAYQIRQDSPRAVVYTADELRKFKKLEPSPDDLRAIHSTKAVFDKANIVDSRLKDTSVE